VLEELDPMRNLAGVTDFFVDTEFRSQKGTAQFWH
jgi:hypothetical protein